MCRTTRDRVSTVARTGREPSPTERASDADRDRVVATLREHGAAGRLSVDELEERVGAALEARTHGELNGLLDDLPRLRDRGREAARGHAARRAFGEHLRVYLAVNILLVAIWALTGMGYFWPIWPILGWGLGVFSHGRCVPGRRRIRHDALARV